MKLRRAALLLALLAAACGDNDDNPTLTPSDDRTWRSVTDYQVDWLMFNLDGSLGHSHMELGDIGVEPACTSAFVVPYDYEKLGDTLHLYNGPQGSWLDFQIHLDSDGGLLQLIPFEGASADPWTLIEVAPAVCEDVVAFEGVSTFLAGSSTLAIANAGDQQTDPSAQVWAGHGIWRLHANWDPYSLSATCLDVTAPGDYELLPGSCRFHRGGLGGSFDRYFLTQGTLSVTAWSDSIILGTLSGTFATAHPESFPGLQNPLNLTCSFIGTALVTSINNGGNP